MTDPSQLVCIIDDDASVRKSLARLFRSEGIVAEVYESAGAYLMRAPHDGPTCLVLDVQMPELNGLDLHSALISSGRAEQVIFITGKGDIPMCARAFRAGAADFLTKPFGHAELLAAVERALARSLELRKRRTSQLDAESRIATLTRRELQVFEGVIAGKMSKEIAADLGTALKTVKVQRGRVMEKLGVESVAQLVQLAQSARRTPPGGS